MEKWVGWITSSAPDGLWKGSFHFGDWLFYQQHAFGSGFGLFAATLSLVALAGRPAMTAMANMALKYRLEKKARYAGMKTLPDGGAYVMRRRAEAAAVTM